MNHCWNQWLSCDPCHEIWPKSASPIKFQLIEVMICFYIYIYLCNITWNGVVPLHPHELCTGAQNYASGSSTVGRLSADFRGSSWFAVRRANLWKCFAPISNIKHVTVNIGSKHIILGVSKVTRRGWISTSILYIQYLHICICTHTDTSTICPGQDKPSHTRSARDCFCKGILWQICSTNRSRVLGCCSRSRTWNESEDCLLQMDETSRNHWTLCRLCRTPVNRQPCKTSATISSLLPARWRFHSGEIPQVCRH